MERHTKGVAVRGINLGDVKRMPIIVRLLSEQRRFDERIHSIEAAAGSAQSSLVSMEALFASLLHRAFRGEL